jgi:hypothetical protein
LASALASVSVTVTVLGKVSVLVWESALVYVSLSV